MNGMLKLMLPASAICFCWSSITPALSQSVVTGAGLPYSGFSSLSRDADLFDYSFIRDKFRLSLAKKAYGDLIGADIVDLNCLLFWCGSQGLARRRPGNSPRFSNGPLYFCR